MYFQTSRPFNNLLLNPNRIEQTLSYVHPQTEQTSILSKFYISFPFSNNVSNLDE